MLSPLPADTAALLRWSWDGMEPHYRELAARTLSAETLADFMADWTRLTELVAERGNRLIVAANANTADEEAEKRYRAYLEQVFPKVQAAAQELKQKLLASGLEPEGFEVPLRKMRAETALFRPANLPLLTEERKLSMQYDKIVGAQTVTWEGREVTLPQLRPVYQDADRGRRERAWRLEMQRQLADRQAINELWLKFLPLRLQLAANADMGSDYRAYRWQQLLRFDYTPADCAVFRQAIAEVVVPAATRVYERRRRQLGLDTLRPWDLDVDPLGRAPLAPFRTVTELRDKAATIFRRVDPQLGDYFDTMVREDLLDLDNRKNKAPGAYCTGFPAIKRPFIFANVVGTHDDVETTLHESGHAFHSFEAGRLPYIQQRFAGLEMAEVASMSMELLAAPYLPAEEGGFYSQAEANRARIEHLESQILFWPYMAIVDAFQHWVYENPDRAADPDHCDATWAELWHRFRPGVDWSGFEEALKTGWHRKLHIHTDPFYYVEYGLAQLGAVQVWASALHDQAGAVAAYRRALALGGTRPLPELYAAAGAKFAFDAETLGGAVQLMEETIARLERAAG
jgi:oligoendopeptidase F